MGLLVIRLFGLGISALSAAMVYFNWQELLNEGTYSFRIAGLAPIGIMMGLYVTAFPTKIGRPETTFDKFMAIVLVLIGAAAGFYNWYLMDPEKHRWLIDLFK